MNAASFKNTSSPSGPAPYTGCHWRYVRAGLLDQWWEMQCPSPEQVSAQAKRARRLGPSLLGALGAVAALSAFIGAVLPALAEYGVSLSASHTLGLSRALLAVAAVGVLALPVWLALAMRHALKKACYRGWELEQGLRKPYSRKGAAQ